MAIVTLLTTPRISVLIFFLTAINRCPNYKKEFAVRKYRRSKREPEPGLEVADFIGHTAADRLRLGSSDDLFQATFQRASPLLTAYIVTEAKWTPAPV
jgi:hypothetical protein